MPTASNGSHWLALGHAVGGAGNGLASSRVVTNDKSLSWFALELFNCLPQRAPNPVAGGPDFRPLRMMNTTTRNDENIMSAEIAEFAALLHQQGVHAALGYLKV